MKYTDMSVKAYDYSPFLSKYRCKEKFASEYYLNAARISKCKRILEFGTATGLTTIPLINAGYYVDSIDLSEEMQEIVREKVKDLPQNVYERLNLILSDMITFQSERKYELVILPDSILLAATSQEDQINTLFNCNRHLSMNGKLAMDFFPPNYELIFKKEIMNYSRFSIPNDFKYLVCRKEKVNPLTQFYEIEFLYNKIDPNTKEILFPEIKSKIFYRYLHIDELKIMLNLAGFRIKDINYEFDSHLRNIAILAEKVKEL